MTEEYREYDTFMITNKEGKEVELAVVDEFDYENEPYVACALVEDDTINADGVYIYKVTGTGEAFAVEKIEDAEKYQKIAEAYMA